MVILAVKYIFLLQIILMATYIQTRIIIKSAQILSQSSPCLNDSLNVVVFVCNISLNFPYNDIEYLL